jgi:hypothetical protein
LSAGHQHKRLNRAHPEELKKLTSEPSYQRVWNRPFKIVVDKEVPDSAGYSVQADHFYFDRDLHKAVVSGQIAVPGMHPLQILNALLIHERTEKSLLDADNPITTYQDAHEMATMAEHQYVKSTGATPKAYEHTLEGIIAYNEKKPITEPPLDLECSPYLDDPDADDKRVLAIMRKLGVTDANKEAKEPNKYGASAGQDQCQVCQNWQGHPTLNLAMCSKINGLVRDHWWCKQFVLGKQNGEELDQGGSQETGPAAQGPGGAKGGENTSQEVSGSSPLQQPQGPAAG